jgi:hypothetical protein
MSNAYDKHDMVKRESVILAGPMKVAAYRVRDPETMEWSGPQFHFIHDNTVLAVMGPQAAKLFSRFVNGYFESHMATFDYNYEGLGHA